MHKGHPSANEGCTGLIVVRMLHTGKAMTEGARAGGRSQVPGGVCCRAADDVYVCVGGGKGADGYGSRRSTRWPPKPQAAIGVLRFRPRKAHAKLLPPLRTLTQADIDRTYAESACWGVVRLGEPLFTPLRHSPFPPSPKHRLTLTGCTHINAGTGVSRPREPIHDPLPPSPPLNTYTGRH